MKSCVYFFLFIIYTTPFADTFRFEAMDGSNGFASAGGELMDVVTGTSFYVTWDDDDGTGSASDMIFFGVDGGIDLRNDQNQNDWWIWIDVTQDAAGATSAPFGVVTFDAVVATLYNPEFAVFVDDEITATFYTWGGTAWDGGVSLSSIGGAHAVSGSGTYAEVALPWSVIGVPTDIAVASDIEDEGNTAVLKAFAAENMAGLPPPIPDIPWFYQFYEPHIPGPLPLGGYSPGTVDHSLPVSLTSFTAHGSDRKINLKWITESEIDNQGFYLYRSTAKNGTYDQLSDLIEGAGNSSVRNLYSYVDKAVFNGITYWYKLIDVDINGVRTEHPVISALPHFTSAEIGIVEDIEAPKQFALKNNYPNPFNPETIISFNVPESEKDLVNINLSVYDMLGKKVKTLINEPLGPHSYTVKWNGKNEVGQSMPTGVYIYILKSQNYIKSNKMILIK